MVEKSLPRDCKEWAEGLAAQFEVRDPLGNCAGTGPEAVKTGFITTADLPVNKTVEGHTVH